MAGLPELPALCEEPMPSTFNAANVVGAFILLSGVFVVAVWDVLTPGLPEGTKTISSLIIEWSKAAPILPFAIGVVIGHLFWK